jgi:hypothetical protein
MEELKVTNASLEKIISYDKKQNILTSLISFSDGAGYVNIYNIVKDDKELIVKTTLEELYKFNEKDSKKIKSVMN